MEGRQPQMVKMEGATEPDDGGQREGEEFARGGSVSRQGRGRTTTKHHHHHHPTPLEEKRV